MLAPSDRDRLEAYQLFAEKSFILLTLALKQRRLNDEEKWLLCAATETVAACEAKEETEDTREGWVAPDQLPGEHE
jgi:hypothetical protein